ncbi:hypothetical protein, partial [Staphylococcus hominis]|uniref:hypothetical protein n=2 Tax=Staphylococcus hominis TaxID=1290 RepID=UPI000989C2F1
KRVSSCLDKSCDKVCLKGVSQVKKTERNLFSIFLSLGSLFAIFSGFFILGIGMLIGGATLLTKSISEE